jgi:cytochrome c-type biogenesis protein CcsB
MPKSTFLFVFMLLTLLPGIHSAHAQTSPCQMALDDFPVLSQGREKPYMVMAKERLRYITGKSSFEGKSANEVICLLSLNALGENNEMALQVPIDHVDVKKFLSMDTNEKTIAINAVISKKDLVRSEIIRQKENNSYKKAMNKLYNRIDLYQEVIEGRAWTLATKEGSEIKWVALKDMPELSTANLYGRLEMSKNDYLATKGDGYQLEITLHKSHVFSITMLICIIGILVSVLMRNLLYAQIIASIAILTEIAGMAMRVMISGRAPITNMYETVMFSGFGALVIALIITFFKKDRLFILGGLGYNVLCLFMMKFANNMLDESISPLVPVLRDNFWLSTHVTTIMLSYAALALSWMLANYTMLKGRFGSISSTDYKYYEELIYTCIKVGIILLSAGIILGGVWADYSWGRFWGWDPKETWSLIVLLFYMAVLHGKRTNWMNTHRFILLSSGGFMTVIMAWFGVNYILASGLHSYGFSEGGAIFIGSFFLIQTLLIIISSIKNPLVVNR